MAAAAVVAVASATGVVGNVWCTTAKEGVGAREGGRRSLWAGLAPTLARAVPANAAQWLAFEAALSVWPKGKGGE